MNEPVIARQEHFRHLHPLIDSRFRILRVFYEAGIYRLLHMRLLISQQTDGIRRATESMTTSAASSPPVRIIADGNLLRFPIVDNSLDPFSIMSAEYHEIFFRRQICDQTAVKFSAPGDI